MKSKREVDLYGNLVTAVSNNVRLMGDTQTINALNLYINSGNPKGFTRREGTRNVLLQVPNNEIKNIINVSITNFVQQCANLTENSTINKIQENVNENNTNNIVIIKDALANTIKKFKMLDSNFDNNQAYMFIYNSIDRLANHDFNCITRDNGQRKKVEKILSNMDTNKYYTTIKQYLDGFRYDVANLDELRTAFSNIVIQSAGLVKNEEMNNSKKM